MKKLVFIALLSAFASFATLAETLEKKGEEVERTGETGTSLGSYVVSKTDNFVEVDGEALPTYVISFQNSDQVIRVAIDEDKNVGYKEKRYVVLSDNINVQYVCKKSHFGIEKLDKKFIKAGLATAYENIDMGAYFHQKVLTTSDPSHRDCIGLIACYYPLLIKDIESALTVNK